ncbi:MAG: M67 family metallopeptidase [Candidatus Firestonebacteria bacterium]
MIFNKEQINEIIQHAKDEYPKEVCGIIAGREDKTEKIYKMINTSNEPEICYFMDPKEQFKVIKEIRQLQLEMIGIYHSHTKTEAYPSKRDCELAFYSEVNYAIISLQNFDNPEIHTFKITDSIIEEENVEIITD